MPTTSKRGLGSGKIDPQRKRDIQSKGGQVSSSKQNMSDLGRKGGQAAQRSGRAHKLTNEERNKGGQNSPTNFANLPIEHVKKFARSGGIRSRSGSHQT
jgi:general stress protein YciG